jgi:hypothetical protein
MAKQKTKSKSRSAPLATARAAASSPANTVLVRVSGSDPPTRNAELGTALLDHLNPLGIQLIEWSGPDRAWVLTLG